MSFNSIRRGALVTALLLPGAASAADRPEQPSAWFCYQARAHRALFASDRAAEAAAVAGGADKATIAKAYRCRRQ